MDKIEQAREALTEFAKWAIREGAFQAADIGGLEIQEKAQELGLIEPTTYDPDKHGPSDCAEVGDEWFVFSPLLSPSSPVDGVGAEPVAWPDFIAPRQYEDVVEGWEDPRLPDFRLIWAAARECGYAVGLHGSMKRDCDLIAAPWVDAPTTASVLIEKLCADLNARQIGTLTEKPLGRVATTLQIDGWFKPIDLSIMPLASPEAEARLRDEIHDLCERGVKQNGEIARLRERVAVKTYAFSYSGMEENKQGDYVDIDDYSALEERVAELETERDRALRVEAAADSTYKHWRSRAEAAEARLAQAEGGPAVTGARWEAIDEKGDDNFATSIYEAGYDGLLVARCNQNGSHPWQGPAIIRGLEANKAAIHPQSPVAAEGGPAVTGAWHVVFDGFPAPEGPRFIEVEDGNGQSVSAGEWRKRDDGLCELVIAGPNASHGLVTSAYHFVKEHYEPSDDAEFELFKRLEAALHPQSAAGEEGKP